MRRGGTPAPHIAVFLVSGRPQPVLNPPVRMQSPRRVSFRDLDAAVETAHYEGHQACLRRLPSPQSCEWRREPVGYCKRYITKLPLIAMGTTPLPVIASDPYCITPDILSAAAVVM